MRVHESVVEAPRSSQEASQGKSQEAKKPSTRPVAGEASDAPPAAHHRATRLHPRRWSMKQAAHSAHVAILPLGLD
jgi:hypothetical protein